MSEVSEIIVILIKDKKGRLLGTRYFTTDSRHDSLMEEMSLSRVGIEFEPELKLSLSASCVGWPLPAGPSPQTSQSRTPSAVCTPRRTSRPACASSSASAARRGT